MKKISALFGFFIIAIATGFNFSFGNEDCLNSTTGCVPQKQEIPSCPSLCAGDNYQYDGHAKGDRCDYKIEQNSLRCAALQPHTDEFCQSHPGVYGCQVQ